MGNSSAGEPDNVGGDTAAYIVEVAELDASVHPDDYPLIVASDFEAGFEMLKAAILCSEPMNYQDIAELSGVDGAYYQNNDFDAGGEIFKYYGWYSNDDRSVLITFKTEGDTLKYHAYTARGIS